MSQSKIKVAQIIGNSTLGGVSVLVKNYAMCLDKSMFEIDFFVSGDGAINDELAKIGRVIRVADIKKLHKSLPELYAHFRAGKYDIVHSHLTTLSVFPLAVAWICGVKTRICHAHSTSNKKDKLCVVKSALRPLCRVFATDFVACSEYAKDWFYGQRSDVLVLKNAVDLQKFALSESDRQSARAKFDPECKVVGFVGRFCNQKNVEFMIEILRHLALMGNYHLLLVGDGESRAELSLLISKYGLSDKVTMVGQSDSVERYYSAMDCFLMTSRFEGLPLVAVEALASGLPLVLSDSITHELAEFCNTTYVSLDQSPIVWANIIDNIEWKRSDNMSKLTKLGYDINVAGCDLAKFYQERVKR